MRNTNCFVFLRILISDDVNKDESFALVITGKHSAVSYDISSYASENFKQVLPGE